MLDGQDATKLLPRFSSAFSLKTSTSWTRFWSRIVPNSKSNMIKTCSNSTCLGQGLDLFGIIIFRENNKLNHQVQVDQGQDHPKFKIFRYNVYHNHQSCSEIILIIWELNFFVKWGRFMLSNQVWKFLNKFKNILWFDSINVCIRQPLSRNKKRFHVKSKYFLKNY